MMPPFTVLALTFIACIPLVAAWGAVGHATVATIAQNYLTPAGQAFVSNILGTGVSMASVASWADTYRSTAAGRFSAGFHYIDAEDSPPTSCSVSLPRDCGDTCIVTAIANYTQRVQDGRETLADHREDLQFLIHFFGDITQPLHDEAEKVGGNQIPVLWQNTNTNLHAAWDTQMVERAAGGSTPAAYELWAQTLEARIDSGIYSSQKADWVSCANIYAAGACALAWAQDANAINCQYVLQVDETGQELSGSYYTGALPYIEIQIAKGGYRLAAWINALATV